MAKLYFRYSCMNSGKTTQLLQVAHNYEERGMNVVILKPSIDTKGNDKIVSRLGVERKVDFLIYPDTDIYDLIKKLVKANTYNSVDCILCDEVHFMTKEQIDQLMQITIEFNIPAICYGLRTDFKTEGFEGSDRLLQIAHSIEELKTICPCGKKAIFNGRKVNGEFVFDGEQVSIDNQDNVEYISLCPSCYYKEKNKL